MGRRWWFWLALFLLPQALVLTLWFAGQVLLAFWLVYGGGGVVALLLLGREVRRSEERDRNRARPRRPGAPLWQRLLIIAAFAVLMTVALYIGRGSSGAGMVVLVSGGLLLSSALGMLLEPPAG